MSAVVSARNVTKRYGSMVALDGVTFTVRENAIYGLLGRNGAGKTTLMRILTGQGFATDGAVEVFGTAPYENDAVLADVCFVKESHRYPDSHTVANTLEAASWLFPRWDEKFAESLVDDFRLPRKRRVKKLSRGELSALGVTIGLASRAPLTLFDEPYLGLDAVARQQFYDHLLRDYTEFPRTVILSTHLIDEVGDLIEHVLLLDRGRLVVDEEADILRGQAVTLAGPVETVDSLVGSLPELRRDTIGRQVRVTVRGPLEPSTRTRAESLGITMEPVSLQQLVVHLTGAPTPDASKELSR